MGNATLIFVDSNVPMYLIGAAHPHKTEAQFILERLIAAGQRLVTDAEVLQEILHRYTSIEKREAIGPALQVVLDPRRRSAPIERDVLRAGEIAQNPMRSRPAMPCTLRLWSVTASDRF